MRLTLLLLLLAGCGPSPEEQEDLGRDLASQYSTSICRFYSDEVCIENQTTNCGAALSFESEGDCRTFFAWAFAACADDVYTALWENEDLVVDCAAELDAVDCAAEPLCSEDGTALVESGACGELDELLQGYCDSGDTGA
jgi:hypothetical protein